MKEKIKQLVAYLNASPEFTGVIGTRLFPLYAKEGTAYPFATYGVVSDPLSKDGRTVSGTLVLYFDENEFDGMIAFADALVTLLGEKYDVGPVETGFDEQNYKTIYTILTINLE